MATRVAGIDLGKAQAKFVVARLPENGAGRGGSIEVESSSVVSHSGRPLEAFADWYRSAKGLAALGATGIHADEIVSPALAGLPEDACLEAALNARLDFPTSLNLVSIGARGYSVLTRDERGQTQQLGSDKCSSGTGETIVKMAARFGLELDQADELAFSATSLVPITARCSVFAKSEMTHFANQGRPRDQLFRGYLDSIARYVAALLARVRVHGPVYLLGGTSRLKTLRSRLSEALGSDVLVPRGSQEMEAFGAAQIAAEHVRRGELELLPSNPEALIQPRRREFREHQPAKQWAHRVRRLKASEPPVGATKAPSILGLDLGSTGSKAVLTSIDSGEIALDVYDRTRGNPVEAAQRLVRTILDETQPDVRAIGVTGSGREAVATVLRAAYPEHADRILVLNEIVAHATAAIRCDEHDGESLSVVEIGGQDAKFVQVSHGRIVESDMNKACSAGTGSFLEEQAAFYGVHDIGEFTSVAGQAKRPPDLGQMCTVFVAEAAAEAHNAGFEVSDLFAGFQHSVIHNYLNRVMGQRSFGKRIFFQGKPASSESLAQTLAAIADREVIVPANPGAMGAWGIGLCALKELPTPVLEQAPPFALGSMLEAHVEKRSEFQCKDPQCATLCNIDRTTVAVGETTQTVFSGGACPKFEVAAGTRDKLEKEAPSAFDEREALLRPFLATTNGGNVVGVPEVGPLVAYIPWATTFLRELGLGVRVLRTQRDSLARGEERCHSFDACAPLKIAHGVADADVERLFLPKILEVGDREGQGGVTCNAEQALPDVIERALRSRGRTIRVVSPLLSLRRGTDNSSLLLELLRAAWNLGVYDIPRVVKAARRASEAQAGFERELAEVGRRTLAYGRATGTAVVAVCGSQHVVFDPIVNAGIPKILRENGVLALPMDCYPLSCEIDGLPRIAWGDANRALRVALAARAQGDVYPLLISSFGCGPASFVEQVFDYLMQGYPRTALETDGHGGAAGYVTRIQSFLHGVRQYSGGPSPVSRQQLRTVGPLNQPPLTDEKDAQILMFPVAGELGALSAAAMRSLGFDAVAAGPASHDLLAEGRRDCSGKECLPYQLIWGGFRKHLTEAPSTKRRVLVQVNGEGACRNCMFSIKDRINLEHMGLEREVSVRQLTAERDLSGAYFGRFWAATLAWDILNQLAAYHRPAEREPGAIDALFKRSVQRVLLMIERPAPTGLRLFGEQRRLLRAVAARVEEAAREFAALAAPSASTPELRTAFLSGDVYVRLDEFSSDGLVRRLNARNVRVLVEPLNLLVEYLSEERSSEVVGMPTGFLEAKLARSVLRRTRRDFYSRVQKSNPWLTTPDVVPVLKASDPLMRRYPLGEAPVIVGSVLHAWKEGICDGVVIAGPWGCSPSLVSESLLRHEREIPMLFVYADGSPIDDRKLNGFAYRLQRQGLEHHPVARDATARSAVRPEPYVGVTPND